MLNSKSFNNWQLASLFMLMTFFIVGVSLLFYPKFYYIDDAQNMFQPFFQEIGRIIKNGELPLLTTRTFLGNNILVDLHTGIFLPDHLLTFWVAATTKSALITANFFGTLETFLIITGMYGLARQLGASQGYSLLAAFLMATNPLLQYVYQASWWNGITGQVWFIFSLSALFYCWRNASYIATFLLGFSVAGLLSSGWPHAVIMFFIIALVVNYYFYKEYKSKKQLFTIMAILFCAALVAFPAVSEFVVTREITNRESGLGNADNFLVPMLSQVLFSFYPLQSDYISWYGGYQQMDLPFGFIGIVTLLVACFIKVPKLQVIDKILIAIAIIAVLLSFSPTQMGPSRYSFRYLLHFSCVIILLCSRWLTIAEVVFTNARIKAAIVAIIISVYFSVCKITHYEYVWVVCNVVLILIITLAFYFLWKKQSKPAIYQVAVVLSVCFFIALHISLPTLGLKYFSNKNFDKVNWNVLSELNNGRILLMAPQPFEKNTVWDSNSAQGLNSGFNLVNGYSPIGYKGLLRLMPYQSTHGIFYQDALIERLTRRSFMNDQSVCNAHLVGISALSVYKEDALRYIEKLSSCGYKSYAQLNDVVVFASDQKFSTVTAYPRDVIIREKAKEKEKIDQFEVTNNINGGTFVLSRVWWPGYRAFINGKELPVKRHERLLVAIDIPAQMNGLVTVSYWPVSWGFALPLSVIGLLGLSGIAFRKPKASII